MRPNAFTMRHVVTFILVFQMIIIPSYCSRQFHCNKVHHKYSPRSKQIDIPGAPAPNSRIVLYWSSDPERAAAALFKTVIQDALGYREVTLRNGNRNLSSLIAIGDLRPYSEQGKIWALYKEIALVLSIPWLPEETPVSVVDNKLKFGIGGRRLAEFGMSNLQMQLQLHIHITNTFLLKPQCTNLTLWSQYINTTVLEYCEFNNTTLSDDLVPVYGLNPNERNMDGVLVASAGLNLPHFRFIQLLDRKNLMEMLRSNEQSFLFIDYNMWKQYPNVYTVNLPSCESSEEAKCLLERDDTIALRIADVSLLRNYAPRVFRFAYNYTPPVEAIRKILQLEGNQKQKLTRFNIESAACVWATQHYNVIDTWVQTFNEKTYEIMVFHCNNDPDFKEYDKFLDILKTYVNKLTKNTNFSIELVKKPANCIDENYLEQELLTHFSEDLVERVMGAIIGDLKRIDKATNIATLVNLPIMLYNADSVNLDSAVTTWLPARPSFPLALAFHHFILSLNWTRIAVISEDTVNTEEFFNRLNSLGGIALHNYLVPVHLSSMRAERVLQEIKAADAHIVIVNTNADDAVVILSVAQRLSMNDSDNYAWIIRERLPKNITLNIKHFTITSYCENGKDIPNTEGRLDLRERMDTELWHNRSWPAQAIALGDAVLTLVDGFISVILKHPELEDDIHNGAFIGLLETSLIEEPVKGIIQNLTYKGRSLEETLVFVNGWPDHQDSYKAQWRVNTTARTVFVEHEQSMPYFGGTPPNDDTSKCMVRVGDPYVYTCLDAVWLTQLVALLIILSAIILLRFTRRHRYAQQKHCDNQLAIIYKRRLTPYIIHQSKLKLAEEVETGKFNCNQSTKWRVVGQASQAVAAKTHCRHQLQSGILREACILMSLKHDHIIRLVGVSLDNELALMLMDVAFFGDLLQFLQSRQYLVEEAYSIEEITELRGEATHVSDEALTRYARQAALALDYLSKRGVVHRDLCASNCVVDANRSLKLAGFCMATEVTDNNSIEILCMKQKFHIQSMAPENFLGEFSPASDMWAFGVLVFELITLGAYTYEGMTANRISKFVGGGGSPKLPHNASSQTKQLLQMCWQRDPDQRITAEEVVTYLKMQPTALRPALKYDENRLQRLLMLRTRIS